MTERYGSPDEDPAFWDGISASTYYDRVLASTMFHHGSADDSVPLAWSETTVEQFRTLGKSVEFFTYDGEPHEFAAAWPLVMERTADFFRRLLKR